jgi:hypothetical protein
MVAAVLGMFEESIVKALVINLGYAGREMA